MAHSVEGTKDLIENIVIGISDVKGQDIEFVEDFFNLAHCLGADPVMWNTWQFARMPNVKRNDHKVRDVEQKVHFIAKPEDQRTCPLTEGIDFPMPILRQ